MQHEGKADVINSHQHVSDLYNLPTCRDLGAEH